MTTERTEWDTAVARAIDEIEGIVARLEQQGYDIWGPDISHEWPKVLPKLHSAINLGLHPLKSVIWLEAQITSHGS